MKTLMAALIAWFASARAEEAPGWPKIDSLPPIVRGNASGIHLAGQLGSPAVEDLQWSFDGRHLGLRSSAGITIYGFDPGKGARLSRGWTFSGKRMPVAFCFSVSGDHLFTCDGGTEISRWELRSGATPVAIPAGEGGLRAMAFSPTATVLAAAADDGKVRIWRGDPATVEPQAFPDHPKGAAGIGIDPGGKYLLTWAGWNDLKVRDLATGELAAELTTRTPKSSGILSPACIDRDGVLWANAPGKTLRWKLPQGDPFPPSPFRALLSPGCFDRSGQRALGYAGTGFGILSSDSGRVLARLNVKPGSLEAAFEPTRGKVAAVWASGTLSLHDSNHGGQLFAEVIGDPVQSLGISTGKHSAVCTAGPDLRLIDLTKGGKGTQLVLSPAADLRDAVLHEPSRLMISFVDFPQRRSEVVAWSLSGSHLKRLPLLDPEKKTEVRSFALSGRGDLLALGTGPDTSPLVKLISTDTGKPRSTIKLRGGVGTVSVLSLDFSPDAKLLAAAVGRAGTFLINVELGKIAAQLEQPADPEGWISGARFSRNGGLLAATTFRNGVLLYDVATRKIKTDITINGSELPGLLDFNPDGSLLACGIERSAGLKSLCEIAILDIDSGKTLVRFPAHAGRMSGLVFLPKGNGILSSANDGCIRLWAIPTVKADDRSPEGK